MIRRPPRSTRTDTLFPYSTLFRSAEQMGQTAVAHDRICLVAYRRALAVQQGFRDRRLVSIEDGVDPLADLPSPALQFQDRIPDLRRIQKLGGADGIADPADALEESVPAELVGTGHRRRSEERREGKECVSTCRSRWST